ncbi:MAG: family 43 glycosylhydrolase [Treponema sp.]|jgi:arabinoxylan arabinofuranohydrolase|nr:family 43 glycosylhydrolase [Treponema sp.]
MKKVRIVFWGFIFTLFVGCSSNNNNQPKPEWELDPPPEAALFNGLTLATPLKAYGDVNPLMTQNFGADPFALVYDERVYVYMTGDTPVPGAGGVIPQNTYDNITTIRILSSSDLVNWTEHPEIKVAGASGAAKWASRSWAPAAAYREVNGQAQFYLYFANGAGGIGVLTADSPTGPFTDPVNKALINSATPNCNNVVWLFDPAVFVDDDGTGYIYFGGGTPTNTGEDLWGGAAHTNHAMPGTIRVAKLGSDMTSLAGDPVKLEAPFSFEDNGCFKRGNTYYYTYCTNRGVDAFAANDPENHPEAVQIGKGMTIAYMTSDNPMSGFTLGNMILTNPGEMFSIKGGNNHHAIFQFRGKWYIVYHSRLLAHAMGLDDEGKASAAGEGYRSTHVDQVNIQSNGTIDRVNGTRSGPARAANFSPFRSINAATIGVMAGIKTVVHGGTSMKVSDIHTGDWLALYGVNFGSKGNGATQFKCRVQLPENGKGVIQIKLDGLNGPAVGYAIFDETAESPEISVDLLREVYGVHDLIFVFHGESYDLEQWQFFR